MANRNDTGDAHGSVTLRIGETLQVASESVYCNFKPKRIRISS